MYSFTMKLIVILIIVLAGSHAVLDLGAPGYTCDSSLMAPSKAKPTSAHAVRPADINLIMAMGDSLTAGWCTDDMDGCRLEYKGLSFPAGGDRGLDQHVTIPNILSKYNLNLFGQSHNVTPHRGWDIYNASYLNMAISGMKADNLPTQANNLIDTLKKHPEIDIKNDWKLLNIFIGYNDICACGDSCWCKDPVTYSAENYSNWIRQALNIIRQNIPKTIVNLVQMPHLEQLVNAADKTCGVNLCGECANFTQKEMAQVMVEYQQAEKQLEQRGEFDSTDDFTLVVQPWYTNATMPLYPNGTGIRDFWAYDCFHYSSYGHAILSTWFWQNMMQPVGDKTINANLSSPALPLLCPNNECPFIRTTKNSVNCQQFNGTCISEGSSCTRGSDCCTALCFNGKCT